MVILIQNFVIQSFIFMYFISIWLLFYYVKSKVMISPLDIYLWSAIILWYEAQDHMEGQEHLICF